MPHTVKHMPPRPSSLTIRRLIGVFALCALIAPIFSEPAHAQTSVLHLYTARHYASDEALYKRFTSSTGIEVKVVSSDDEPLLERLRSEGRASPADVLLLADATRLERAEQEGFFAPLDSPVLSKAIPADRRSGNLWFGFTTRARVLVIDPTRVDVKRISRYEDLANPEFKGLVCTRSAAHPYMLSLIGSRIVQDGETKTTEWAKSVVANLARAPKGGDTDQIKAVASGECAIALSNSYYYVRLMRSANPADRAIVSKTRLVWPNQSEQGTHVNVSGGGMLKNAPNPRAARAFLEFLASPEAQAEFASGNNEWPVVKGVSIQNPELESLGKFKADPMPVAQFAAQQRAAQRITDSVGWR